MVRKSAELVKASAELKKDELAELDSLIYEDALAILNEIENRDTKLQIALPVRMSVSTLVNLKQDPNALALNIRRPLPNHIDQYARRGTEFHLWIEKRYKDLQLFDDDIFDSDFAGESDKDLPLKELQDKWLGSEWAKLEPVPGGIEVPFETVVAGVLLRGRIDAVYKVGEQYTVVDWKTGKVKSGDDLETAAIQLAMYRLAYSKLYGIPIEKISAAFHYVGSNETVSPADLYSERELEEIITSNLAL
jgi:DNA helicase-2/ATP-dependent DNA helicase PcrA